ncbi:MAG: hypothetical protein KY440_03160, partial [Actinobacteria bacterium]|nr:hypothetical protein [Actinomycetota bacterium]
MNPRLIPVRFPPGRRLLSVALAAAAMTVTSTMPGAQAAGTPVVGLSPASGPAGTMVVAAGGGFDPVSAGKLSVVASTTPQLYFSPGGDVRLSAQSHTARVLASFTTDATGAFSVPARIPTDATGVVSLQATTAGRSSPTTFTVAAAPTAVTSSPPAVGGYAALK